MLPIELVADAAEPSALASPTPVKVDKVDAGVQMDGAPVKVDKVDAGVQMDGAPVKVDKVDAGVQTDGVQGHRGSPCLSLQVTTIRAITATSSMSRSHMKIMLCVARLILNDAVCSPPVRC